MKESVITMIQVAERLKEVREEKGYTVEYVADKTGILADTLSLYESGEQLPDVTVLMKLSKVYEMSIDRMIYKNTEAPMYNEANAVYANVKPAGIPGQDEKECLKPAMGEKQSGEKATSKKARLLTYLVFPLLCVVIYIFLGVAGGFWHPGWLIFLGIPLYYLLVWLTSRIERNVDDAVQEYVDEENK